MTSDDTATTEPVPVMPAPIQFDSDSAEQPASYVINQNNKVNEDNEEVYPYTSAEQPIEKVK